MKKMLFLVAMIGATLMVGCKKQTPQSDDQDSTREDSTLQDTATELSTVSDTTMWGHKGDGTTSSVLEFITEKGDTLYLSRTSDSTGEEAEIVGTWRDESDRYAVTTRGKNVDDGMSLRTCINVTELMGVWKCGKERIAFYADGTVDNDSKHYKQWSIVNGQLCLSRKVTTEYGETDCIDRMQMTYLDENSLTLITPQHEEMTFKK